MSESEPRSEAPDLVGGSPSRALRRLESALASGESLSPKYQALADYVLRSPEEVAFSTAAEVARSADVSEATVIRFANWLSYDGYPQFKNDFKAMMRRELSTVRRLRASLDSADQADPVDVAFREESANLAEALRRLHVESFDAAVSQIIQAAVIYSVGTRASASLASFFAYQVREISPKVVPIVRGGADSMEQITPDADAVVVAFAFPRYPKETVALVEYARTLGIHVIGVTDSFASPLTERSDTRLLVPVSGAGFVDLYAAPLTVAAALVLAASHRDESRAVSHLSRFEEFSERVNLFWGRDGA